MAIHSQQHDPASGRADWLPSSFTPGLVSVLIPTHNRADLLPATLESILAQSYPAIELVVVDDGSTDATADVLAAWQARFEQERGWTMTLVQQDNQGAPTARNRAAETAHGQWLKFFDDDDLLAHDVIAAEVAAIRASGADAAYGPHAFFVQSGDNYWVGKASNSSARQFPDTTLHAWVAGWDWALPASMLKRAFAANIGRWNPDLVRGQDLEFKVRMLEQNPSFVHAPSGGVFIRRHTRSVSHNSDPLAYQQMIATLERVERAAQEKIAPAIYRPQLARLWAQRAVWFYQDGAVAAARQCEAKAKALDSTATEATNGIVAKSISRIAGLIGLGLASRYRKFLGRVLLRSVGYRPGNMNKVRELPLSRNTPSTVDLKR